MSDVVTDDAADRALGESAVIREYLGDAYEKVAGFGDLLREQGELRGLIGPREVSRLWERHLLNSAAVVPFLPTSGVLVDVGSVVVHIFTPPERDYYSLERHWSEAKTILRVQ